MTTLQSFIKKLSPLGIYDISEGTNIYAELSAYADAFDRHRNNMNIVFRECFITTSESYGLETREKAFGKIREGCTLSQRREMLRLRRGFGDSDFTVAGFDKFMRSLGIGEYSLLEMSSTYEAAVTLNESFSSSETKWIENQIRLIMPAHLVVNMYYGGPMFDRIDSLDRTYADFDSADKSWAQLDS